MKYNHAIKMVALSEISPNNYNPNEMDQVKFDTLKKELREEGFLVPLILRAEANPKKSNKYIIIDGEHRWKAAVAEGYVDAPCIIVDKKLSEAKLATINLNNLRGQFDSIKLAHLITDLNKTYSLEELELKLGIPSNELHGLQELAELDLSDTQKSEGELDFSESKDDEKIKFEVLLTDTQYKIINTALSKAKTTDPAEALKFICLEFLSLYGKQGS